MPTYNEFGQLIPDITYGLGVQQNTTTVPQAQIQPMPQQQMQQPTVPQPQQYSPPTPNIGSPGPDYTYNATTGTWMYTPNDGGATLVNTLQQNPTSGNTTNGMGQVVVKGQDQYGKLAQPAVTNITRQAIVNNNMNAQDAYDLTRAQQQLYTAVATGQITNDQAMSIIQGILRQYEATRAAVANTAPVTTGQPQPAVQGPTVASSTAAPAPALRQSTTDAYLQAIKSGALGPVYYNGKITPPNTGSAGLASPQVEPPIYDYTIQSGDTLGGIAAAYGTSVQAIAEANGITNPNVIQAGAQLKIPVNGQNAFTPTQPAAATPLNGGQAVTVPDYNFGGNVTLTNDITDAIAKAFPPQEQGFAQLIAASESKGKNTAVGPAGEVGIFQIHPVNWYGLSQIMGISINAQTLQDPYINAMAAKILWQQSQGWGRSGNPWATAPAIYAALGI